MLQRCGKARMTKKDSVGIVGRAAHTGFSRLLAELVVGLLRLCVVQGETGTTQGMSLQQQQPKI